MYVKRDDLTHPEIMGNKWRKLKYNLEAAKSAGYDGILTLGGAYSNHIAATAAACAENNLKSIGIIRGQELSPKSNPTLEYAYKKGMQLIFIDRDEYKLVRNDPKVALAKKYPEFFILPEGGTNDHAIKGCRELLDEIVIDFDWIVTPIGTGGTFLGLLSGLKQNRRILGVSSLKGSFIHDEIEKLRNRFHIQNSNYEVCDAYHFGGYGKATDTLIDFINWFKEMFDIPLDPIYTGKSFFGVFDMIKKGKFEKNLRIVLLHTGGLQGIEGFNRKNQNIIQ